MSLSASKCKVSLNIKVMHFRIEDLQELKGKGPWGQGGEDTVPICLSKPVPPSVLGEDDKPSLSALPSPVVPLGQTVTLWCHCLSPFAIFRLFKRDGTSFPKLQEHQLNTFTLGPVTIEHARSYMCIGANTSLSVWSTNSDPLQIVVTGRRGPAQPGNRILGPCASAAKDVLRIPSQTLTREREPTLRV